MQNGDIDGTFDLAISDVEQWKALGNADVITAPSLGMFMLTLDHSAAALRRHPCAQGDRLCVDREGLVQALLKGNGEAGDGAQPAGNVGGRASARRGEGLLRDAAGLRVRPREGQGRAGAVGASGRLRDHRAGFDRRPLHGQHHAERGGEPEADRHQRDGAGDRRQPVARGLFPARESRHADHGLLSGLRRSGELSRTSSSPAPTP